MDSAVFQTRIKDVEKHLTNMFELVNATIMVLNLRKRLIEDLRTVIIINSIIVRMVDVQRALDGQNLVLIGLMHSFDVCNPAVIAEYACVKLNELKLGIGKCKSLFDECINLIDKQNIL